MINTFYYYLLLASGFMITTYGRRDARIEIKNKISFS